MREDNLLCLRQKPCVPRTANSRRGFRAVPSLIRGLAPSGIDQIRVADLTCIRLAEGFVRLAAVLDASRAGSPAGRSTTIRRPASRSPPSTWRWRPASPGRAR